MIGKKQLSALFASWWWHAG